MSRDLCRSFVAVSLIVGLGCVPSSVDDGAGGGSSGASSSGGGGATGGSGASSGAGGATGGGGTSTTPAAPPRPSGPCTELADDASMVLGTVAFTGEQVLELPARTVEAASWASADRQGLVLRVDAEWPEGTSRTLAHVIVHNGRESRTHALHLGWLEEGVTVSVSIDGGVSAPALSPRACVGPAYLAPAAALGLTVDAAPVLQWPAERAFSDAPLVVGRSVSRGEHVALHTGSGSPLECEGSTPMGVANRWAQEGSLFAPVLLPAVDGPHPMLRGSATGIDWTAATGGEEAGFLLLRPLPVDLDLTGYDRDRGRAVVLAERFAPWMHRLAVDEARRAGGVDEQVSWGLERYLWADVRLSGVGGAAEGTCTAPVWTGGVSAAVVFDDGTVVEGPRWAEASMHGNEWRRVAIPLPASTTKGRIQSLRLRSNDDPDGVFWPQLGRVFLLRPDGDAGASLDVIRSTIRDVNVYLDAQKTGCQSGVRAGGPQSSVNYRCPGAEQSERVP